MEVRDEVVVPCTPDELAPWIEDLSVYPRWMGLVHRAERVPGDPPAWSVDLLARLGPLARSKRLRMERALGERPGLVRFERRELDGRRHGRWVLTADYGPEGRMTRLAVCLTYDGSLWTAGLLERALHDEIERSKARLVDAVSGGWAPEGTDGPTH